MLESIFLEILNMSITSSVVIIAIMLLRYAMRKQPKIFSYILWSIALFRLLCPYSISFNTSIFNIVPPAHAENGQIEYIQSDAIDISYDINAPSIYDTAIPVSPQQNNITKPTISQEDIVTVLPTEQSAAATPNIDVLFILSLLWFFWGYIYYRKKFISVICIKTQSQKQHSRKRKNIYL